MGRRESEHLIVGGGAHGLALASKLARAGRSVTVFEASEVASGASGGWGKRGVRANRRDIRELELARIAQEMWTTLSDDLGGDVGYRRIGGVSLRETETSGLVMSESSSAVRAAFQAAEGIPTSVWSAGEVRERLPTSTSQVQGASFCPNDGVAAHEKTTLLYAADAQKHGTIVYTALAVRELVKGRSGRAIGVRLSNGTVYYAADSVVLAANARTNLILEASGIRQLPMWTVYPQALLVETENAPQIPHLVAHDARPLSVKVIENGLVMLSGGWRGRPAPRGGRGELVPANVRGNLNQLEYVFPGLGKLRLVDADASRPESATIDGIPVIDLVQGLSNVFVATGWNGHGWALVPAVADLLSNWIISRKKPAVLEPFSWARFTRKVHPHV